jgi:membrane protein involved in colicin uptake
VRVILDDDEVPSNEDEPLQMRLWLLSTINGLSSPASATADVMAAAKAVADKDTMDKRIAEEAMTQEVADKEPTDKRAVEEAVVKEAVDKEATDKRATEETTTKEAADKDVTDKRAAEEAAMKEAVAGAAGGSSTSGQVPSSAAGAKRAATPSGSTLPVK